MYPATLRMGQVEPRMEFDHQRLALPCCVNILVEPVGVGLLTELEVEVPDQSRQHQP